MKKIEGYTLYHFEGCPFCLAVRAVMDSLEIEFEMKDIRKDSSAREELIAGGGKSTVPCLRIEKEGKTEWMYESSDIADYLRAQF